MRKTWSMVPLLCLATFLLLPVTARAQQVLFTTFGPNNSHDSEGTPFGSVLGPDGPPYVPFVGRADAFTLPFGALNGSYGFSRLDLALGQLSNNPDSVGPPPYVFQVQLTADANGLPGTVLESWIVTSPTPNPPTGIFTVYDSLHLELVAERQYWVTVNSTTALASGNWFGYSPQGGLIAFSLGLGGNWNSLNGYQGALNVWGTPVNYFLAPVGLVESQTLRILVAGLFIPAARGSVKANLSFVDLDGKAIGHSLPVTVNPGEIVSVDFPSNDYIKRPGQRIEVIPVITPLPSPNAAQGGRIQASVEVRDATTGSGTIFALAPTSLSDPLAPALAPQSLAHGQTMLINVMALPNHPCVATLSFADKKGRLLRPSKTVDVPPGTGMSFDLNADTLDVKSGERIDVRPIMILTAPPVTDPTAVGPPINSACQASVEVFNHSTGRTETYQSARVQSPGVR